MAMYSRDGVTFTPNELKRMGVTEPAKLGFVIVQDIVPVHDSFTVKMVKTGKIIDGKVEYIETPLTDEEKLTKLQEYSDTILKHVDIYLQGAIVDICRYDTMDSIGKYLIKGNPYLDECTKISLWVGNCYVKCNTIKENVISGKRGIPTIVEVLQELPVPNFISTEDAGTLLSRYEAKVK